VELSINTSSRLPICRQLSEQIREAVARGKLQPDERLPSVRELSRSLVVNPNTVARVYGDLEHEGVLTTRPGLGVFVARPGSDLSRKVRKERLHEAANRFLTEAVHLGFSADEVTKLLAECEKQFQWRDNEPQS
jgi:GntR family transcriptional regulator